MADLLGWDVTSRRLVPVGTVPGDVPLVAVFDAVTLESLRLPVADAARGLLRHARTMPAGSAARAEAERQGLAMLRGEWLAGAGRSRGQHAPRITNRESAVTAAGRSRQ